MRIFSLAQYRLLEREYIQARIIALFLLAMLPDVAQFQYAQFKT